VAQFRCDEISVVAQAEFNDQAKSQKKPVEEGRVVDGLGAMMENWRRDALGQFPAFSFSVF
jgi:protein SEY1